MAKAREIILGSQKREPCSVTAIDGVTRLDFALTLLTSAASTKIAEGARSYAQARGVTTPTPEDILYLRGKWAHTILLAAVDPDSPLDSPQFFFDSLDRVESYLDDAAQVYVVQRQKDFQDEHAPLGEGLTPEQFLRAQAACIDEIRRAGNPDLPFSCMRLAELRSFCRQSVEGSLIVTDMLLRLGSQSRDDTASSSTTAPTSENES